jgi:hypothetical protein
LVHKGSGRHSRAETGPGDTGGRKSGARTGGTADVAEAEQDEPPDTGSAGLRMFNLGSIPASVTPPRSWRRAAWFTVVTSVAALVGLLVVAVALMCPPFADHGTVALPYFPDGTPLASIDGGPSGTSRQSGPPHPPTGTGTAGGTGTGDMVVADMVDTAALATRGAAGTGKPRPTSAPMVVTLSPGPTTVTGGEPVADPVKLIKRTRTFFKEVTSNAKAAADLTTSVLHDDVLTVIRRKYGGVSAIRVQSISLDPTSGMTVSVVQVVNKDGSTGTQTTTLQFTLTGDPKIVNFGSK